MQPSLYCLSKYFEVDFVVSKLKHVSKFTITLRNRKKKIQHSLKADGEGKKNGFIITGSPGSGKSAFLTELCFPEWDKRLKFKALITHLSF